MKLSFSKMHGIGNDYIYFNCFEGIDFDPVSVSQKLSLRHFSVGADGIVLICRSEVADAKMRMFNADGSEGRMCGNAIRCIGKYLYEKNMVRKTTLTIETESGIKTLSLRIENDLVQSISVDMGNAIKDAKKIPVALDGVVKNYPIEIAGQSYRFTAVSMGNPHAVVFTQAPYQLFLEDIGPLFERHPLFPERVNTEFVHIISKTELEMRVWERGSGETWACGTGACASVVAAVLCGYCPYDIPVCVHLRGGDLSIICDSDLRVTMEGPAEFAFEGEVTL